MGKTLGIFIVGTSPMPIYLSMKHLIEGYDIDKCLFLCTQKENNGTEIIAERLKEIFSDIDIEVILIERTNTRRLENIIINEVLSKENLEGISKIYFDFTGGTKLQSSVIRNRIKANFDKNRDEYIARIDLNEVYINGYDKNIQINGKIEEYFDGIEEIKLEEIVYIHGYEYIEEGKIKKISNGSILKFEDIQIEDGICEFYRKIKISNKNATKELFNFIYDVDSAGGDFTKINIISEELGEKEKYKSRDKLRESITGTKAELYRERINFV